ncbi:MAG: hypothetical protein K6A96_04415 [Prevotella sp.]|nr:hypothetical protein [Prevotella sp.]
MTTPLLFKEYIWLVNTIHDAGGITLKEINEKWTATEMSGGVGLSRSTFRRHKKLHRKNNQLWEKIT